MVQFTHQAGLMPEVFVTSQKYLCNCQKVQQRLSGKLFHHSTSGFTFGISSGNDLSQKLFGVHS